MSFYGDNVRWFVGRVINMMDPEAKGRVQVRVFGIHGPEVLDSYLPWAKCVLPTTEGGVSGIGRIPQIANGAFCFGIFLDGQMSQSPIVLGSMNHFGVPSSVQVDQVEAAGRSYVLEDDYVTEGLILNPDLVQMYDQGNSSLQTKMVVVMQYLVDNGLDKIAAAGVVGNLVRESSLDPVKENHSAIEDSYGIAQWNERVNRYSMLIDFANKRKKQWEDFFLQLEFLVYDMKTNPAHKVWTQLSDKTKTVTFEGVNNETNSTFFFMKKYLVPGNQSVEIIKREEFAVQAFDVYHDSLLKTAAYEAARSVERVGLPR